MDRHPASLPVIGFFPKSSVIGIGAFALRVNGPPGIIAGWSSRLTPLFNTQQSAICGQARDDDDEVDFNDRVECLVLGCGLDDSDDVQNDADGREREDDSQTDLLLRTDLEASEHPER